MLENDQLNLSNSQGFTISTNKCFLDIEMIYQFLCNESYWANGIAKELVEASIKNTTLCFGVYEGDPQNGPAKQVGFARVVSDLVRFAYLCDVFILPEYRGQGLSKWLLQVITEHPKLTGTSFLLITHDAHTLYEQFGFKPIDRVEDRMIRPLNSDEIYRAYGLLRSDTE
jgi:ribosomal protein S18 acetylase RimI-like enzyme